MWEVDMGSSVGRIPRKMCVHQTAMKHSREVLSRPGARGLEFHSAEGEDCVEAVMRQALVEL